MKHHALNPKYVVIALCVAALGGYIAGTRHEPCPRITTFRYPPLRRVVGEPGDTIEIRGQVVYINGVAAADR